MRRVASGANPEHHSGPPGAEAGPGRSIPARSARSWHGWILKRPIRLLLVTLLSMLPALAVPSASEEQGLQELRKLLDEGHYADAEGAARDLLRKAEIQHGARSPEAAGVLDLLVVALIKEGKAEDSETQTLAKQAVAIKEATLGPDDLAVADSLENLGQLWMRIGSDPEAKLALERSLAIREKHLGREHPAVADSLHGLGVVWMQLDSGPEAKLALERALAIREKSLGPEHRRVADTLNDLANLFQNWGRYAEAKPLRERVLAMDEKRLGPDHPDVAADLNNVARSLESLGLYAAAKPLYERALAIAENVLGAEHVHVASGLNNLAALLTAMGSYSEAKALHERALAIREKQLGPEHRRVAQSLNNLANVHRYTRSYSAARPLLERALAIWEKTYGPEDLNTAPAVMNLGNLLREMGLHAEGRPFLERAVAMCRKEEGEYLAGSLSGLAMLLRDMGSPREAEPLLAEAVAILEQQLGSEHPKVAIGLADLARVAASSGDPSRAFTLALRAEELGRDHLRLTSTALAERLALSYASTRASGLDLALTLLESGGGDPEKVLDAVIRSRALVLDEMASRHRGIATTTSPEVASLRERYFLASQRLANLFVRGPGGERPDRYRAMLDEARREREIAEAELAARSTAFRQDLTRGGLGLTEVQEALPPRSALVSYVRYDKETVGSPGTTSGIGPAGADPRAEGKAKRAGSYLAVILVAGRKTPAVVFLGREDEIEALVSGWRTEATQGPLYQRRSPAETEAAYRRKGEALKDRIWDPVAAHLQGAGRVFIVPDGILNLVSFAALPAGKNAYLAEKGPLLHLLSAEKDLHRAEADSPEGRGLLALGGPAFDETSLFVALTPGGSSAGRPYVSDALTGKQTAGVTSSAAAAALFRGSRSGCVEFQETRFEPLALSAQEVSEVVDLWRRAGSSRRGSQAENASVLALTGAEASEQAFKTQAPGRRILHLATHGFFLGGRCPSALDFSRGIGGLGGAEERTPRFVPGENPLLLSGLALAGGNHRASARADEDDGILTAEEVAAMDLSGVEWAVLSACDTGVGEVRAGEGVLGLRRAFQVAGARTVIMSLWSVEDDSARQWMKALYEARLLKGHETAEAMREASLDILRWRRANKLSTHPFYWAGFVAAGDWK